MEEKVINQYVKRTQKDYSLSFKLSVVSEIGRGKISVTSVKKKYGIQGREIGLNWLRKYGPFDWDNQNPLNMAKTSIN